MDVKAVLLLALSGLILVIVLIVRSRKGPRPRLRPLPAFLDLWKQAGYAAESGGAIHLALGSGGINAEDAVTSLAGLQVVEALANTAVSYQSPPIVTVGDPTLLPLAQDILRRAYERNGCAELYDPGNVRFIAPSPTAYAAGAAHVVASEKVTASTMDGAFGTEVSLIADAGARRDMDQLAAAANPSALGALYPAIDRLAIGEELFAAGAEMTEERSDATSLLAQDILRVILVLIILGTVLGTVGRALMGG